eukprot:TRINITY_DN11388_c0_g1_i1.p1 TRINITY_DN11388_c0_g1~~TRINITY_DN11388_c0_g1_i1.p1  ORF type:complete len:119 (+),score=14.35 TRINITY_DN11388_c0_g1_i1:103-459(+)
MVVFGGGVLLLSLERVRCRALGVRVLTIDDATATSPDCVLPIPPSPVASTSCALGDFTSGVSSSLWAAPVLPCWWRSSEVDRAKRWRAYWRAGNEDEEEPQLLSCNCLLYTSPSPRDS